MGTFAFKMPDIGEGVVEGEVVEWMVAVGDSVKEDDPILSVMTDKATVEIPCTVRWNRHQGDRRSRRYSPRWRGLH